MEILKGKAHKLGDDINTDYIIPAKYKGMTTDMAEMSRYLLKDTAPGLVERIAPGDFLVAGKNFGCGSSREAAPLVIQEAGLGAVLAISFGRIFFRNAINIGLPVVECDTTQIQDGDALVLDLAQGIISVGPGETPLAIKPQPEFIRAILSAGGILKYLETHQLQTSCGSEGPSI